MYTFQIFIVLLLVSNVSYRLHVAVMGMSLKNSLSSLEFYAC